MDLETYRHQEWLGLLQPTGLVASAPALIKAQAVIDRGCLATLQLQLLDAVSTEPISSGADRDTAWIDDFPRFTQEVLGWLPEDLVGAPGQEPLPPDLSAVLPSYGETLRPTYAVRDPDSGEWVLLIRAVAPGLSLDADDPAAASGQGWKATIQAKFERLLRETSVPVGLLVNGTHLRLVYAPKGESSGHVTFPVQAMTEVPGRLILGALDMLVGADRLFNVPQEQRLGKLLANSRAYQAEVSTKLAGQVLDALWELLQGFQAADAAVNGQLLMALAATQPQHIYGGLITTLMRLVFLLYAEDEGLMPDDEVYQLNYSVAGLYEKLREDEGNYPDTMDQRYGAWTSLLSLFRLVYDGGGAYKEYLPARHGQLFDPDEYPFLEGRPQDSLFRAYGSLEAPRIADRVIYRMLEKLLVLDGERLSYRALDEQLLELKVCDLAMGSAAFLVEACRQLADLVVEGWNFHGSPADVPDEVEPVLYARRLVAQRCLYGVDKNPLR